MAVDRRIWYPDETCVPSFISGSAPSGVAQEIVRFFVPSNHILVIRNVTVGFSTTGSLKTDARVILTDRDEPAVDGMPGIKLEGSLMSVEYRDATGIDSPGFAVSAAFGAAFPCNIMLPGGRLWRALKQGLLARSILLLMSGYTFPITEA